MTDGISKSVPIGRFAPTPSGEMHAGNLLCALLAYLSAKSKGGKFLMRIEDLDALRCPKEAGYKISDMLAKLGISGDEEPIWQSDRGEFYERKEAELRRRARVYPCFCTRAQLHAAEAPRLADGGVVYSGTCRNLSQSKIAALGAKRKPCYRVAVPDTDIEFIDGIAGHFVQNLERECGDFIIKRSDGVYAYQFAVSADDGESRITEVVRGNDLLDSTPRQIWLLRLLGYEPPEYYHIPLVCDSRGRKLSKSEGDSAAKLLREFSPEFILGALAFAAGIIGELRETSLSELIKCFSWDKVRKDKIYLPQELLCR